ncbi:uncharacterized protein LOC114950629 [Acropora millepora]|uniref:uncharacterized protein LOC114950629 n=1 Tax=Acropora millepora TaxID=45264 RepID=UPI001CF4B24A|nr:uncharacterized protein LOC114950629 [Acropora millepora]
MSKLRFINNSVKEALLAIPNSFSSRPQLVWCQVLRTLKTHDQLLFERKLEHSTDSDHGTQRHEPYPSYTDYTDGWLTPPPQGGQDGVSPGPMPFPTPPDDITHPKSTEDHQCVIS